MLTALVAALLAQPAPPPLTWESLPQRIRDEAAAGFVGVVLVVRDGAIVLHEAHGLANREKSIAMKPDTVLGIGSTPIDFTKVAILQLAERGKLSLDDPVGKFFANVPEDKRSMTLDHLMTGRSGLPDFHDVPADRDKDHSWIDRDEAVRRILGATLLFPPGKRREHSHSGFGLLAAVVEIASGKTYPEYVRENVFAPAGMTDSGFFGEPIAEERLAIGYGPRQDGTINAPPFWGKTSWLVMGSGGQVATAADMNRFAEALHAGKLVSRENLKRIVGAAPDMLVGGDMHGYEIMYTLGAKSRFVVMSNAGSPRTIPALRRLGRDLAQLASGRATARFALGVEMNVDAGQVIVARVVPGSAAERDGIRVGDRLITANDAPLGDDAGFALQDMLASGEPVRFVLERDGKRIEMSVKPNPK